MSISIGQIGKAVQTDVLHKINQENKQSPFQAIFQSALNMVNETNELQKQAEQASIDFTLGKIDNLHDVMIAQEKASTALQFTVQVRDSILDSYNEIMRMQV